MEATSKDKKQSTKKNNTTKLSDEEKVTAFMAALDHPLKTEIDAVRAIIKNTDDGIKERIKWNAPSYYFNNEDMVTFHVRPTKHVHLVFHHPAIVKIKSAMLEGDYKDRRMAYFTDMEAIQSKTTELENIMKELVTMIKNNSSL
jgi:hypothetical protein